ncbi:MAG: cysteine--1-D-myo-inosityl 2-amino-2-deoxy-alpha-D-glucopyranoside ligase [Actinobacteria bacterium]|uniref:L-cysteine:1D-myo-inositol 2-amino-2-deoxy-alpha-D-glucopyranoside ligase n=1 Tax=freshwater metagenome TaxID=449393 RepID=A0A6J6L6I2_9ZZZZ|nr:cysteine--1-D-myo-inosityl 2-amino-2-deoxy-alpha-D-glucopyranoside ligase [Actinomycetota bacterium]
MKSWASVDIPMLDKAVVLPALHLTNSKSGVKELVPLKSTYRMYVCGITPYDATHLGHAATYLTFDLINRFLRAQGAEVNYVQNITDIDDPLLERAKRDGLEWSELATSQINLFTSDMVNLRVIPPKNYIGAVEAIPLVVDAIEDLQKRGSIYPIEKDYYFSNSPGSTFGELSHLSRSEMELIFAERGGNPNLLGKLDSLDCLVWMSQREGEPGWPSSFGVGRPGWHIECTAIAIEYLKPDRDEETLIDIQGGGSDLIFPHHEMCRSQAKILTGKELAANYVHAGMIGLDGEKMSKSLGNLVLVSTLVSNGVDPMAIRLALMGDHYRIDRMWSDEILKRAEISIKRLRQALSLDKVAKTEDVLQTITRALADDLNTDQVVKAIEAWVDASLSGDTGGDKEVFVDCLDALLGLKL